MHPAPTGILFVYSVDFAYGKPFHNQKYCYG